MLTPEEAQKRAERLSQVVFDKMNCFLELVNDQERWLENEIKTGILSDLSSCITELDKKLLKHEVESIINHHKKTITSMKAIKFMCEKHHK